MAIGGIASMHGNSTVLLGHAEGVVVDVMARIIRDDTESEIRRNAARNLRIIGCGNETGRVASRKGVLDTLSNSVMNDSCFGNRVESADVLARMASCMRSDITSYPAFLGILSNILSSSTIACVELSVRTIDLLSSIPENQVVLAEYQGMIQALARAASYDSSTPSIREHVTSALLNISCEPQICENMISVVLLTSLVKSLSIFDFENRRARENAVRIVVKLSSVSPNKTRIAHHDGLLNSLVQFSMFSQNQQLKNDV
eukprot:CAMPEP_0194422998 /NCGR_PEP_ID=MMETSP0176-20130528/22324_1 /TAXON_ID=216777 /ORGANISM="Proboscia alata, Strain PI-D3" /LENGTH=257 /DNA_ID=CAMNT_0039232049 /DNA_START=227 /DNA_END=996 /DNA_ORIENTATION=-